MDQATHELEMLETRRHLSAVLHGSTLFVRGDTTGDNTIHVGLNGAGDKVEVDINTDTPQLFDKTSVQFLNVRTGAGNDTITVDSGVVSQAWIFASGGNNTITTGSERDFIYTGGGNDVINAGDGNNYVASGSGDDNITTGSGQDRIYAGAGNDTVSAGGGNDIVYGEAGNDRLDGGNGNDRMFGGDGSDTLTGDAGDDRLWGQGGNDSIVGGDGNDTLGGIVGPHNTLLGGAGQDTFYVKKNLDGQTNDFDPNTDILHPVQPQDDASQA